MMLSFYLLSVAGFDLHTGRFFVRRFLLGFSSLEFSFIFSLSTMF